nr:reverse transcriptase domain-containing protein [Tanacetum cinerariifolium]
MYEFRECSSCGALYTKSCACSKGGFVDKFVCDPNKIPDSSQRPPHDCPKCGNPVDGLYCRHCALLRYNLKEVWFTICDEDKFSKDFINTSESSNDDSNIVNAPQEPIVFNQDPGENSSQSPPQIDHHCCYGCDDSLDDIFCQRCTCESCGNGAHYGYNCLPKVPIISNPKPCHDQNVEEFPQTLSSFHPTCYSGDENSFACDSTPNFVSDSPNVFNPPSQPPMYSYEFGGNNAQYGHDFPPQVPFLYDQKPCYNQDFNFPQNFKIFNHNILVVKIIGACMKLFNETKDSLIMGDERLDTIPKKESDEFIKSSVENLVPIPSESEDEHECDVPVCNDFTTFSNLLFDADDDFSSSDNELFSNEDIPKEIYSNPLFDKEIIYIKIDPHHFNAKSDLIESLLNQDSLIISSSKIDSLLDEFASELILLKSIPSRIDEKSTVILRKKFYNDAKNPKKTLAIWCAEAIVVPPILAEQFELKHSLIKVMTSEQFFGLEKDNPHNHVRWFNKITSTIKYKDVPNSVIKLILFPFSLAGAARRWLEKEPPRSITTWDALVSKFINEFFPPSRPTNLGNEISNFQQKFDESFHEAWE